MTKCQICSFHAVVLLAVLAYLSEPRLAYAASAKQASSFAVVAYSLTQTTSSAPWEGRIGQAMIAFDGKLWLMGGSHGDDELVNDVWSSPDGVNWVQAASDAGWQPRFYHSTTVFDNKVWVLGGTTGGGSFNDVWCSSEGSVWAELTPHASWSAIFIWPAKLSSTVVFRDKMWLFDDWQDIWCSSDGVTWTLDVSGMPWQARQGYAALVYDGRLWAMGGSYSSMEAPPLFYNDTWRSSDGTDWVKVAEGAPWRGRSGLTTVAFDNAMWIAGGEYWSGGGRFQTIYPLKDVWRSVDGVEWERMPDMPYSGMSMCAFNDKLWMIGGAYTENVEVPYDPYVITRTIYPREVWCLSRVDLSISAGHGSWYEVGDPLNLTLVATGLEKGAGPLGCQWLKDNSVIPGATDTTYHVDALTSGDAAAYTCQVTMPGYTQPVTTNPVEVRVFPAGSLPACGVTGTLLSACACLLLGIRTLSRQQNNRKSAPSC